MPWERHSADADTISGDRREDRVVQDNGVGDDIEVGNRGEQFPDAIAEQKVIISDQNSNPMTGFPSRSGIPSTGSRARRIDGNRNSIRAHCVSSRTFRLHLYL